MRKMSTLKVKCPRCNFVYDLNTKAKAKRSLSQNALYWVWMTILGADIGHTKEEMHYVFKRQFLKDKMPVMARDEFIDYLIMLDYKEVSTTKLVVGEMKEYLDNVFNQAAEININLPVSLEQ